MQRLLILPVAALLVLPAVGCGKVQARAELKKGNSYYQQEQYAKALDYFKRGMELDPDATFAWRSVGLSALALYRPGDNEPKNTQYAATAVDAFEKYLADYPDDAKVEDYLLSTYVNARKFDEAIAFIDQRLAEKPEEAVKLNGYKIRILTQAGRLDQAFQLAAQVPAEERAVALYSIAVSAWDKSFHDPGTMRLRVEEPAGRHGSGRDQEVVRPEEGLLRDHGLLRPAPPREGQGRDRRRTAPRARGRGADLAAEGPRATQESRRGATGAGSR